MSLRATPAIRRLRRALLGTALVLHVGWLALGAMPVHAAMAAQVALATRAAVTAEVAATAQPDASMTMPCHGHGMPMGAPATPAPPQHHTAPAHLPCCAQGGCVCAAGPMLAATLATGHAAHVHCQLPPGAYALPSGRSPTPELRPPIHS